MFYNTYLKKGLNKMVEIFKEFLNKERPLNDGILRKLQNNLRTEFIYNSNAIEGNTLTLRETDIILQFGITVKGKSLKEHNEVKGQEYALDFLNEVLKKEEPLSIRLIREFHALILNDDKDNRGRFKQENNTILGAKFQTTPFYQVEEKLQELIDNFNESDKNLIEKVAKFHNDFEMVHPFNDGNGRTGRLLMNLELMKNGYPITIIKNEDRDDYHQALEIASIDKNYIPLTEFIKRSIENTFWIYDKHFNEETKEKFENSNPIFEDDNFSAEIEYKWEIMPFYLPENIVEHPLYKKWEQEKKNIISLVDELIKKIETLKDKESFKADRAFLANLKNISFGKDKSLSENIQRVNEIYKNISSSANKQIVTEISQKINNLKREVETNIKFLTEKRETLRNHTEPKEKERLNQKITQLDKDINNLKSKIEEKEREIEKINSSNKEEKLFIEEIKLPLLPSVGKLYNAKDINYLAISFWEEYDAANIEAQRFNAKLCANK